MNKRNIYRIIDANLNRAREGIRVAEEVARLYFNDANLGSNSMGGLEKKRSDLESIVFANLRRSQEATRVLEEFGKLINPTSAQSFKKIRFRLYAVEQNMMGFLKKH
jgi:thiamine-phosphate pyrophosphorylase